ncbi:hypothetical protein BDA99DRAFT_510340 [Phascolomyces articulosus]|uniref:Uncharacterized protein n=1 Tax=Phascolomyces articulosus TaxID=60185 RepID=A0AAD5K934_9FUNG|nr:hypothetical protein BDA99DRAFT_510340 [Phascolomyces articulosus]
MDPCADQYSFAYSHRGSINHPSVDRLSDFSIISDNSHDHYNSSRNLTREKSLKGTRSDQRPRASSQPVKADRLERNNHDKSFGSEPLPTTTTASASNTRRHYANNSMSMNQSSLRSSQTPSSSIHHSRLLSNVFSDTPSETRLRIERSISNILDQDARSLSRSSSPLSRNNEFGYHEESSRISNDISDQHDDQQEEGVTATTNKKPNVIIEAGSSGLVRTMSQHEINANYHAWESTFQKRTMDAMDERYKQVTTSLESRIKMLEEKMKKANEEMEESREYIRKLHEQPTSINPAGTQADVQVMHEINEIESKSRKVKAIEAMLCDLGFDSIEELDETVHAWRNKARMFDQVQCYVDQIDDLVWSTPFTSILSVCQPEQNNKNHPLLHHSLEDACDKHRAQFEKALLEAKRDKNRAFITEPYSSEHLDVNFKRLVEWAYTVRRVTS